MRIGFAVASGTGSRTLRKDASWAAVPLRLIAGYGFIAHGYTKLANGPENFVAILQSIGVPAPEIMGWATILTELVGGLAILIGALVPLASIPLAAIMLTAAFTVHLPYGFSSIRLKSVTAAGAQFGPVGYEAALLYLAILVALVLGGSGPFSVDGLIRKLRSGKAREPIAQGELQE